MIYMEDLVNLKMMSCKSRGEGHGAPHHADYTPSSSSLLTSHVYYIYTSKLLQRSLIKPFACPNKKPGFALQLIGNAAKAHLPGPQNPGECHLYFAEGVISILRLHQNAA